MDGKCIFCEIAAKRIPAKIIYEDDNYIAFLDIRPLNRGHTLVVPKEHLQWAWEIQQFGPYMEIVKTIALAAMKALDAKWANFVTAGLGVPHAHFHVVPRFEDDGHPEVPNQALIKQIPENEMDEIAEKIRSAVPQFLPKKQEPVVEEEKEEVKEIERSAEDVAWLKRQAGLE